MFEFYLTGCVIVLAWSLYKMFTDKIEDGKPREYEMMFPMILLSWFSIVLMIYSYFKYRDKQ